MNLLAGTLYDPSTAVSKSTASLLAMTAIDTTNLRLTGTVPPSGKIYWKIKSALHGATTYPQVLLGVMSGASVVARAPAMLAGGNLAATTVCAAWAEGIITGTPGAAFTYDAAYGVETLVASTGLKYGGPNNTTGNDAFGGISFELWDACPVFTPSSGAAPTTAISTRVDTVDDLLDTEIGALTTAVANVQADTDNIQARLPAALVGGRMDASVGAMAADTLTASALAADAGTEIATAIWANATRTLSAGTNIVLAKGTGITGFNDLDAAGVRTALGLASANLDTQLGSLATAANLATVAGYIDTEVASIKGVVDKLDTAMELDGAVYRFTTNALEMAPAGGGGLDAAGVRAAVGLASANLDTQLSGISSKTTNLPAAPASTGDVTTVGAAVADVASDVSAVKGKTDQLAFTVAGQVDGNMKSVAGTAVTGVGSAEDPWGP